MSEPFKEFADSDKVVHEPRRFAMLNALSRCESADYVYLQRITGLTHGNFATHLAKLERAGLVRTEKRFVLRRPNTRVIITEAGRDAVRGHWRLLKKFEEEVNRWQGPGSEGGEEQMVEPSGAWHSETEQIPILRPLEALERLSGTGRNVEAVIAGFDSFDVLFASGLEPEAFRYGELLIVPNMLLRDTEGEWIGIDDINVGYAGTGPRNAQQILLDAGLPDRIANLARTNRFFYHDPSSGRDLSEQDEPYPYGLFGVETPLFAHQMLVVRLEREDLPGTYEAGKAPPWWRSVGGGPTSETAYEAWLKVMGWQEENPRRPAWLGREEERVARVFLDPGAALDQGFTEDLSSESRRRHSGPYQVIVEQGRLQLWLPTYPPADPTELLSDEAYEALDRAELYPREITGRGAGRRLFDYVRRIIRRQRPWFDVSKTGTRALSYVPVPPGS